MGDNLSLGFPEPEHSAGRRPGLEAALARFQAWKGEPGSPIRAIHHQPAAPGRVRGHSGGGRSQRCGRRWSSQGIERLYSHQAEAFRSGRRGPERGGGDAHRQRQDALLQPAGAEPAARGPRRARHVPVPHQGAGRGPAARVPGDGGRDGLRHPRLHLRRRHAAGRAQGHPRARQRGPDQPGHAAQPASCRTTPAGRSSSRTCATS